MVATVVGTVLATLAVVLTGSAGVALFIRYYPTPKVAIEQPVNGPQSSYLEEIVARLADLEVQMKGLPSLWEEERDRAKKHADRAAAAYRSAEEVLSAITGGDEDEEEGEGLREDDGEAGGLMSPVFGDVAGSAGRAEEETALRERARRHLAAMG